MIWLFRDIKLLTLQPHIFTTLLALLLQFITSYLWGIEGCFNEMDHSWLTTNAAWEVSIGSLYLSCGNFKTEGVLKSENLGQASRRNNRFVAIIIFCLKLGRTCVRIQYVYVVTIRVLAPVHYFFFLRMELHE